LIELLVSAALVEDDRDRNVIVAIGGRFYYSAATRFFSFQAADIDIDSVVVFSAYGGAAPQMIACRHVHFRQCRWRRRRRRRWRQDSDPFTEDREGIWFSDLEMFFR